MIEIEKDQGEGFDEYIRCPQCQDRSLFYNGGEQSCHSCGYTSFFAEISELTVMVKI